MLGSHFPHLPISRQKNAHILMLALNQIQVESIRSSFSFKVRFFLSLNSLFKYFYYQVLQNFFYLISIYTYGSQMAQFKRLFTSLKHHLTRPEYINPRPNAISSL